MRQLLREIVRFRNDKSGNVAVIFTLALLPILSAMGVAVDYSRATQVRSKLQSAIDAASVGSVARKSPGFIAAGTMTGDGDIPAGVDDVKAIFDGNMSGVTGYTLNSVTRTVTKTGMVITSTVSFSANVPTMFLGVMGKSAMTVTGSSTSVTKMPQYIDFYLLLDNSPSMGVGATQKDRDDMVAATTGASFKPDDKCAFACHDTKNTNNYYNLAKTLGVKMRIDVLRTATQQLMDTAAATQTYTSQFRMAIYDFGKSASSAGLRTLFALSSSLSSAKTAAGKIDLMTVYGQNENDDQDTQYTKLFPAMNTAISAPGTGASGSPLKYLFFVSDGVADEKNTSCLKPKSGGSRCMSPINPLLCKTLKDRNIKIAVLYTTYLDLPDNDWYNAWIKPFNKGPYEPTSVNSEIAKKMEECASPGLYFEVTPTQGISEAMTALFQRAVSDARISS